MQGIVKTLMDLPELTGVDHEIALTALVDRADPKMVGAPDGWDSAAVVAFGHDRIRYALEQRGFPLGVIRSAVSGHSADNPLRARRIAEALKALEGSEDLRALAVLFKNSRETRRSIARRWPSRRNGRCWTSSTRDGRA